MRGKILFCDCCFSLKEDKISRISSLGMLCPHLYTKSYGCLSVEAPKWPWTAMRGKKGVKRGINLFRMFEKKNLDVCCKLTSNYELTFCNHIFVAIS